MTYLAETIPEEIFRDLIDEYWNRAAGSEIVKPTIVIPNNADDPFNRIDLANGDALVIKSEGPEMVKYRGNVHYYDKTYPLSLEFRTTEDRQRIRNFWRITRKIIFSNIWVFNSAGYQLVRIVNYQESVGADLKIWRCVVKISLESAGISIETI